LRRLWHLLGWFVVVDALITIFGVTTAPLLLSLAADVAVGWLIICSCIEIRAALFAAPANRPLRIKRRWSVLQALASPQTPGCETPRATNNKSGS
jgi:hypothetical protein